MTLYWWMHWFWITIVLVYVHKASSLSSNERNEPKIRIPSNDSKLIVFETKIKYGPEIENEAAVELEQPRKSKAIGILRAPQQPDPPIREKSTDVVNKSESSSKLSLAPNKTLEIFPNTSTTETVTSSSVSMSTVSVEEEPSKASEEVSVHKKFTSSMLHLTPASVPRPNLSNNLTEKKLEEASFGVAAITGTSFGILIFLGLVGSISFIMCRRRYLNKPQTLNDKCSNLDSNGYIDDSTLRENSEEMYSLDNDSFLNSLEAMTIQNYWTDSVKHTKL